MDAAGWNARAAIAENAVRERYVRGVPGIAWGRSAWPPYSAHGAPKSGGGAAWHYWWSAHLVDAAVDAARHRPSGTRRRLARALVRGTWLRNGATFSRTFYDDLAWLGLAVERGGDIVGYGRTGRRIAEQLEAAIDPAEAAVPWHVGSHLFNAPANGPAAILLARGGRVDTAARLADGMERMLHLPDSGLVRDGVVVDKGERRAVDDLYTYCQGVVLNADAELALRTGEERFVRRAAALVDAIERWTAEFGGVLPGQGGGDGGLFAGITVRHLALAAESLDAAAEGAGDGGGVARRAAASARALVLQNAEAVWAGRGTSLGAPLFAADWRRPADPSPDAAERDLSVQAGAWLALEAAVRVTRSG